ncbi:MAG: dockerin type I domain-containing protein, partial [Phycisphaerae bacterium]
TIVRVGKDNGFVTNGLPSSTRLTLASGGLLDINTIEGDTQQLDGLAGDGTVELGGNTLQIGDELAPGLSVGKLTIAEAGQVNLGSLTVSTFELKSATRFDQLVLEEATMELGGALTVNLIDGYDPEVGTMFHLIQGDANGVFDTLTTDSSLAMLPFYDPENMDPGVYARATYVGDANLDNKVSLADLSALAGNWNSTDATWEEGDFNGDGKVSLADLSALAGNWNIGVSNAGSMPLTNVPEPATLSLLAMGGLATLIRRKRK